MLHYRYLDGYGATIAAVDEAAGTQGQTPRWIVSGAHGCESGRRCSGRRRALLGGEAGRQTDSTDYAFVVCAGAATGAAVTVPTVATGATTGAAGAAGAGVGVPGAAVTLVPVIFDFCTLPMV